ncbi:hypothetical protein MHU86_4076 [Fragilaria crotonensis]|nr:hypothetical protein MHU86_4076 [Fragilaria crotonensis]
MTRTTASKSFIRIFVPGFALLLLNCHAATAGTGPLSETGIDSDSQHGFIQQFGSMIQRHALGGYSPMTNQRRLGPHKHAPSSHGSSSSGYKGCLDYSSSQLSSKWIFKGQAPACSSSSSSGSGGSSGGSSGSGGSGSSGSSSSGSGSSGSSGSGSGSSGSGGSDSESGGSGADDGGSDSEAGGSGADDGGSDSEAGGNGADDGGSESESGGNGAENGGDAADEGENCDCTFAKELMDMELLSCSDASRCPASCGVCMTCMRLLGCANDQQPQGGSTSSSKANTSMYLIGAALCVLVLAAAFILSRRRKDEGTMGEHLVGSEIAFEPKVFLAPADPPDSFGSPARADAATTSTGSSSDVEVGGGGGIWLAPVNTGDDDEA